MEHEPLIPTDALDEEPTRISKGKFFCAVGGLALVCFVGFYAYVYTNFLQEDEQRPVLNTRVPEGQVMGPGGQENALLLPKSYAQVDLTPKQIIPEEKKHHDIGQELRKSVHEEDVNPFLQEPPRLPPPPPLRQPPGRQATKGVAGTPSPTHPAGEKPKPKKDWLFSQGKQGDGIIEPPFPAPKDEQQARSNQAQGLFPQATWAIPQDPTRVLYRSQLIQGILQHDINTDVPGTIRVLVEQQVEDKFGQGQVLLPQYTVLIGSQEGKPSYGDARVKVSLESAELPNGTVIAFSKTQAGDISGAAGIAGKVNNHWGKVILGAGISALLNIGTRAPFGSTEGVHATLPQEYAKDVGQSLNRTGQEVVRRELTRAPTITVVHGTPVTLSLMENVSFQTPPVTVAK